MKDINKELKKLLSKEKKKSLRRTESRFPKITHIFLNVSLVFGIVYSICSILFFKNSILSESLFSLIVYVLFLVMYYVSENFYKTRFKNIPLGYYYMVILFTYFSVILGSLNNFYEALPIFDDLLHFTSGIILGLLSILIMDYFITKKFGHGDTNSDLLFLVIVGALTAISIGVFWEFYEYSFDLLTGGNMQRGLIIQDPASFDPTPYIRQSGRFIDPSLTDTMGDLLQSVIGITISSIYSFFHLAIERNIYSKRISVLNKEYLDKHKK